MPIDRYFQNFPIITYSNNSVVDITRRVVITERLNNSPYAFYPYDLTIFERPDQFSTRYYEDPFKSWIVYHSNKITDPYYEWHLQDDEFYGMLENKYGSVYNAQTKIKYYRHNWEESEELSLSGFNALTPSLKKYWQPQYDLNNTLQKYVRKQKDWYHNTNKIFKYAVSNTSFIIDEKVDIVFDVDNTGSGQVVEAGNNIVCVQHLSGVFETSNTVSILSNSYIYGTESTVNTVFTSATVGANNINAEEEIYYNAVTYFNYEYEKNEFNKSIRVIDNSLTKNIVEELYNLMRQ